MSVCWKPMGLAVLAWALCSGRALAQGRPFLDASAELSPVTDGTVSTTWQVARLAGGVHEEGRFGVTAGIERQRRGSLADWTFSASGYRRAGDWTFSGGAGFSPQPHFYYRHSLEAEIARRITGGLVLHGAYRYLAFPATTVHLIQPAASWYFRRGYVQARGFLVRNTADSRRATTVLLRGSLDVSPRVRLQGGTAIGSRIFDVSALPGANRNGWIVFASAGVRITPSWMISASAGSAHEDPLFSQHTIGLGVRWEPR